MNNKTSQTHIYLSPNYSEKVNVSYSIEYTEKNEAIKDDYSNVKKVKCLDLEEMITCMFHLRELGKYNINLYTLAELGEKSFIEDGVNECEVYTSNALENKQKKAITKLEQTIKDQQNELNQYKAFLGQYNASKTFEKWQKENNTYTYYFRLRHPSLGTHPRNGLLEINGNSITHNNREYWGCVKYDRELTDSELFDYDLDK